jgi:DNA-directed RNA polymerase specialized sigma24 family protein
LCHGQYIREQAAEERATFDRELLRLRDEEKLSDARIATRLNISRSRVHAKIRDARRRERVRQGIPLTPLA